MKKSLKLGLSLGLAISFMLPSATFASSQDYINKFQNMDFQSMMQNTNASDMERYMSLYEDQSASVDSKYDGDKSAITNTLKSQSIIYANEQGKLQMEFAKNDKEFNQKYSSIKTQMEKSNQGKIQLEEAKYSAKDKLNQQSFETEKSANVSKHKANFLSYKADAQAKMNAGYRDVGNFAAGAARIRGSYNAMEYDKPISAIRSQIHANGDFAKAMTNFESGPIQQKIDEIHEAVEQAEAMSDVNNKIKNLDTATLKEVTESAKDAINQDMDKPVNLSKYADDIKKLNSCTDMAECQKLNEEMPGYFDNDPTKVAAAVQQAARYYAFTEGLDSEKTMFFLPESHNEDGELDLVEFDKDLIKDNPQLEMMQETLAVAYNPNATLYSDGKKNAQDTALGEVIHDGFTRASEDEEWLSGFEDKLSEAEARDKFCDNDYYKQTNDICK